MIEINIHTKCHGQIGDGGHKEAENERRLRKKQREKKSKSKSIRAESGRATKVKSGSSGDNQRKWVAHAAREQARKRYRAWLKLKIYPAHTRTVKGSSKEGYKHHIIQKLKT